MPVPSGKGKKTDPWGNKKERCDKLTPHFIAYAVLLCVVTKNALWMLPGVYFLQQSWSAVCRWSCMSLVGGVWGSRRLRRSTARPLWQVWWCSAGSWGWTRAGSGFESHVLGKQNSPPGYKRSEGQRQSKQTSMLITQIQHNMTHFLNPFLISG